MTQQFYWQTAFTNYLTASGIPHEVTAAPEVLLRFPGNYLPGLMVKVVFRNEEQKLLKLELRYDWSFDDAADRSFRVPSHKWPEACYRCVYFNKELPYTKFCLNTGGEVTVHGDYYFSERVDLAYLYQLAQIVGANADLAYPVLADRLEIGQPKTGGGY